MTGPAPLRIAIVEFSPSGGLYQFAAQLAAGLAALGHDVELLTGPDPEWVPRQPGLTIRPILPTWHPAGEQVPSRWRKGRRLVRAARYVTAWAQLSRHVRRSRPDVVQLAEWRFALDGLAAGMLAQRRWSRITVDVAHTPRPLVEQHGHETMYKSGFLLDRFLGRGYRRMDAVAVLGEKSREELLAQWPDLRRVPVMPHGDESLYAPEGGPLPAESTGPRLLFFGTWTRYKGLEDLLDAFELVRRAHPAAELVIAGPVSADVSVPAIERRAATIGGVRLMPGYVPLPEVAPLVQSARAVVAPYRRANASGVVHLAMSLGRPVIVTDVGDLAVAVADGVSGLVVPPGTAEAFAAACCQLLEDSAAAGRLGRNGYDALRTGASWPEVAARFEALYRELLPPAACRPPGSEMNGPVSGSAIVSGATGSAPVEDTGQVGLIRG